MDYFIAGDSDSGNVPDCNCDRTDAFATQLNADPWASLTFSADHYQRMVLYAYHFCDSLCA